MKGIVEQRAVTLGRHIAESGDTVRQTAKKFGISKSTVHKDVSSRLKTRKVLEKNKKERHIRGGLATREKYLHLKQQKAQSS